MSTDNHDEKPTWEAQRETFLANDFVRFLRIHDSGKTVEQLASDLHEVVAAVKEHAKKGSLKINLTIEPQEDTDEMMVTASLATTLSLPRPAAPKRTYFTTESGGLSRHHPNQLSLFGDD